MPGLGADLIFGGGMTDFPLDVGGGSNVFLFTYLCFVY